MYRDTINHKPTFAISGTKGSSGLGSVNMEQMDNKTIIFILEHFLDVIPSKVNLPFEMVNAGLHWSRKMSKQIDPLALMLG